jgi:Family of unknown function (DUF6529)
MATVAAPQMERRSNTWALLPFGVLALVALTLGIVARHQKTGDGKAQGTYIELLFTSTIHMKAWLATTVAILACAQLFTAAWIFRKLPLERRAWVNVVHRWTGRTAFVLSLPVAYHCIFRLGFQGDEPRVVVHSLAGCAFYGGYVAKVLVVKMRRYPAWVIPTIGGLLFTAIITIWYTSALWFFTTVDAGL